MNLEPHTLLATSLRGSQDGGGFGFWLGDFWNGRSSAAWRRACRATRDWSQRARRISASHSWMTSPTRCDRSWAAHLSGCESGSGAAAPKLHEGGRCDRSQPWQTTFLRLLVRLRCVALSQALSDALTSCAVRKLLHTKEVGEPGTCVSRKSLRAVICNKHS